MQTLAKCIPVGHRGSDAIKMRYFDMPYQWTREVEEAD